MQDTTTIPVGATDDSANSDIPDASQKRHVKVERMQYGISMTIPVIVGLLD